MEQQASVLKDLLTQLESQENADQEAPNGFAAEFLVSWDWWNFPVSQLNETTQFPMVTISTK